ncbi:MAG: leucyl aminopeptidase [Cellulomonadaceae bacterium]|jgi:leucyl aminopeptidase|nr:leucyl aminopeptidase [Cellulomonadaceae bacterium]
MRVTDVSLSAKNPATLAVDALVIGTCTTSDGLAVIGDQLPTELARHFESVAPTLGLTGAPDEVRAFPAGPDVKADVIVLTGLGEREPDNTFTPESLRRGAGAAIRSLAGSKAVAVALPSADETELAAIAEGVLLGAYAYTAYLTGDAPAKKAPPVTVDIVTTLGRSSKAKTAVDRAAIIAAAVNATRDLVNTPPNVLYPASFADAAKAAARDVKGVKVTVLDDKQLLAGGYGGLVGVGQGSTRPPRLVKVTYKPVGAAKPERSIALVGKGITFDTGGISIKPSAGMAAMTMDMAGAAVVLHTVLAAARLGVNVAVTAYLCLAENMPGGGAARPGDVITMRNGTTVEITNTDAEGRLVMADGLADAVTDGADTIIDIATLTGAQMLSLGLRTSGVMGNDGGAVRDAIVTAADTAGETMWAMPLQPELAPLLKSDFADLLNAPNERWAGMSIAGTFLREFVAKTPWAHIDIAGPAFNEKAPYGYTPKCGTGVGVRTLVTYLESL